MDVLSHGLWPILIYKTKNLKVKRFKLGRVFLFGIFPDLFAFTPAFAYIFGKIIFTDTSLSDLPHPEETEPAQPIIPFANLTNMLYNLSHSIFIFLIVFSFIYLIFKKPIWEMGAWLLHILMDIPTHSYAFYPTPFLWPFSEWKFNGFSWGQPWFMILNVSLLITFYLILYFTKKKIRK